MCRYRALSSVVLLLTCGGVLGAGTTLSDKSIPFTVPTAHYVVLERAPVRAVVVDNSAVDDAVLKGHRAGYAGVASLTYEKRRENLFVPTVAGLNFDTFTTAPCSPDPSSTSRATRRWTCA